MQNVQAYLKMIISTFKEQPLRNTRYSFSTETCCERTKKRVNYIIHLRKKVVNGPNVLENSAYSLSTFLFFDEDILGNEAATELRIKAKLSNLRQKPKSEHGVVLHLTIRPYNATMQFPWL